MADPIFPCKQDFDVQTCLAQENYQRSYNCLEYEELDVVNTTEDDFYGEALEVEKVFVSHTTIFWRIEVFDDEEQVHERFGLDEQRIIIFTTMPKFFDDISLVPKVGDRIVYEGDRHEVRQIKRRVDSHFGIFDPALVLEVDFITSRPTFESIP